MTTKELVNGWNWDLSEAPANIRILIQSNGYDMWATFDPAWGKGRGAWFNDKNQVVGNVWCWQTDTEKYLSERPTGYNIVLIK